MLFKKRQSGQPSGALKLRSELGFDSFILPGVGADLVTGAPVIFGAGASVVQGSKGAAINGTNTTTTTAWTVPNSSAFLSLTEATIVIAGVQTSRSTTGTGSFGCASSGSTESSNCGAYIPYSDGKVYWDFGGLIEGSSRLSVSGLSFSDSDVFVFTSGPRGMEIWQNGKRVASNSGSPTRTSTTNAFGLRGTYKSGVDPFRCYAFGYSRKQLSMAQSAELSRDLWGTAFVRRRGGLVGAIAAAARRRVMLWG